MRIYYTVASVGYLKVVFWLPGNPIHSVLLNLFQLSNAHQRRPN